MRLWRADTSPCETVQPWQCWTDSLECALAYTDNPGFGGPIVTEVDLPEPGARRVLDLSDTDGLDAFRRLAERLGELEPWTDRYGAEQEPADVADRWHSAGWLYPWEESADVARRLAESPYQWIVYQDDYPDGCVTWRYIGREPLRPIASRAVFTREED